MRLFLWFTLFTICSLHFTQAGIYRRYVRRNRPRPPRSYTPLDEMMMMPVMIPTDHFSRRGSHLFVPTPWPSFLYRRARSAWTFPSFGFNQPPKANMRFRQPNTERQDTVPNFHHQPTGHHYPGTTPRHHQLSSTPFPAWRPLDFNSPIGDPTFDYAPPSMERVRFHSEGQNRRTTARSNTLPAASPFPNRPPPPGFSTRPSLWKMLAHKQRSHQKRPFQYQGQRQQHPGGPYQRHPSSQQQQSLPYHHHHHNQVFHDEADIFPRIPNMVYFRPNDVISSRRPGPPPPFGLPPRHHPHPGPQGHSFRGPTTSSPQWSSLNSMSPPLVPAAVGAPATTPTSTKKPTVLHAVKTTASTITTTHNSVGKPNIPTESLEPTDYQGGHKNHRHHQHDEEQEEFDESTEESENIEKVIKNEKKKPSSTPSTPTTTSSSSTPPSKKQSDSNKSSDLDKLDMVPAAPIFPNSFNILDSVKHVENDDDDDDEDDHDENHEDSSPEIEPENEIPATVIEIPSSGSTQSGLGGGVKPRPVFNNAVKHPMSDESSLFKTSTSISVSVSKDRIQIPTKAPTRRTTTTSSPRTPETKSTTTARATSTTSPTTTSTQKPTKFPKLPTMPAYKKKPTPVYARKNKNASNSPFGKYSSSSSSSSLAKEMNGSGEIVVITAGRSKVKEYKPQFIGDNSQLLTFDKVAEGSPTASSVEKAAATSTPSPSSSTTTTKSPLQEFDPMQLLHSWFTKSSD
ncbi:mucin-5AC isoform X2 [Folsomia candida]|uniref:mucin-5AC isoform X2 n=1 Tax=Folsomia candida TaxID=158441 RepID=UPI000B9064BB|nr:mucin-5AC isoform X2 [Folsomia candida]